MQNELIDKIFGIVADPLNEFLKALPASGLLGPLLIIGVCLFIAVLLTPKDLRLRWTRIIFWTAVLYLALLQIGVE